MVPNKDAKGLIYGTCHKCRGPSQSEYKEKATKWNGKQAGEVFRTRHAQGRDGKLGNYRLCRRQESSGPPEGNLQKMKEKTPIELIHLTRDRGVWSELSNSSLRQHDMSLW